MVLPAKVVQGSPLYLSSDIEGLIILHSGLIEGERIQPKFDLFPENKLTWAGELTSKAKI